MQQVNGLYDSYHLMIQKWSATKMHVFKHVYKVYENDFKPYIVGFLCLYLFYLQSSTNCVRYYITYNDIFPQTPVIEMHQYCNKIRTRNLLFNLLCRISLTYKMKD